MRKIFVLLLVFSFFLNGGCTKDYLNVLNDKSLLVPETLGDLQALLDHDMTMNGSLIAGACPLPILGATATDDFYLEDQVYNGLQESHRKIYTWSQDDTYDRGTLGNWSRPFVPVFYSNIALRGVEKIQRTNDNAIKWDNVKGSALFYRAYTYFFLSQLFAPDYDGLSAGQLLGLPLRVEPDISVVVNRSSLADTYQFMLDDLHEAINLLPATTAIKTRPSQRAVYALLARIYLVMSEYEKSYQMANLALTIEDVLLDYNTLDLSRNYPITPLNVEVVFHANMLRHHIMEHNGIVDPSLWSLYSEFDIRKGAFYNTYGNFRGSYDGTFGLFGGITTSELVLIRAETSARLGKLQDSMSDLNYLLKNRIASGKFIELIANTQEEALDFVIQNRRMEMVNRGLGWSDLRRLNREDKYKRTLKREIHGQLFVLEPGDERYVFLIPKESIGQSKLIQN